MFVQEQKQTSTPSLLRLSSNVEVFMNRTLHRWEGVGEGVGEGERERERERETGSVSGGGGGGEGEGETVNPSSTLPYVLLFVFTSSQLDSSGRLHQSLDEANRAARQMQKLSKRMLSSITTDILRSTKSR